MWYNKLTYTKIFDSSDDFLSLGVLEWIYFETSK